MFRQFEPAECNVDTGEKTGKLSTSPEYCGAWRENKLWVIEKGQLQKDLKKGVMVVCRRWGQSYINPVRSLNTGLNQNQRRTIEAAVTRAFTTVFGAAPPKNQGKIKTELVKSVLGPDVGIYYETFITSLSGEVHDPPPTIDSILTKDKFAGFFGGGWQRFGFSWESLLDGSDEIVREHGSHNLAGKTGGGSRRGRGHK